MKRNDTYTATVFSNRMYVNEREKYVQLIDDEFVSVCNETMKQYQRIMFSVYNLLYLEQTNKKEFKRVMKGNSIYKYVIKNFAVNVYFANSIINQAKGIISSQVTLNKDYKEQTKEKIKTVKDKIKMLQKSLDYYILLRKELPCYKQKLKDNPDAKIHIKGIKNLSFKADEVIVRYSPKRQEAFGYGKFEYQYLNKKIIRIKNFISKYTYRLNNLENKLNNLEKIKSITFRNNILKEMRKAEDITQKEKLKEEFFNSKYYKFQISGVNIAKYGNYVFFMTYVPDSDDFDITIKFPHKEMILHHIDFPYKKKEIIKILKENLKTSTEKKEPLCFELIRKYDKTKKEYYYQFKLTLNLLAHKRINESVETGIVGIDFNYGHIDLTEINEKGQMLKYKTIYYDLDGTSKQNEQSLRKALNEVGQYVKEKHKCLVIEDLNTKQSKYKFNTDKEKQRKLNKVIHSLPVALYKQSVEYIGQKYEFAVYYIKPAYTSIIGKLKYADKMKLNSHISASYVIARRGLGFKEHLRTEQMEQIPNELRSTSLLKKWNYLNKLNKKAN